MINILCGKIHYKKKLYYRLNPAITHIHDFIYVYKYIFIKQFSYINLSLTNSKQNCETLISARENKSLKRS